MRKQLVKQDGEFSYYMFSPDVFHLYDYSAEKSGREEPVHRYTASHIIHQLVYLIGGGVLCILYEKKRRSRFVCSIYKMP